MEDARPRLVDARPGGGAADDVALLEAERRRARAVGAPVPATPVAHVRMVDTGRSPDGVRWATGEGWAAVIKVVATPDGDLDWDHGARELLAYRSGLLAALPPGVRAPACLAVVERGDGTAALWLEGVEGPVAAHWPFAWYREVAAGLGRTQGAYVRGVPLPDEPWLNVGSLRAYADAHPCEPGDGVDDLRCDDGVIDALEALPRTLCHHDLHPRNAMAAGGEVVVIDWASVGTGTVGEDVATLVASAVLDGHVPGHRLDDLFEEVVAGYADGLAAAGLAVDRAALARAVGALLVVKLGWVVARRLVRTAPGSDDAERVGAVADVVRRLAAAAREAPPRSVLAPEGGAT